MNNEIIIFFSSIYLLLTHEYIYKLLYKTTTKAKVGTRTKKKKKRKLCIYLFTIYFNIYSRKYRDIILGLKLLYKQQ